jgi:fido (protein-threonine AMPylation protein)
MKIFHELDPDLKKSLKAALRDLWTHTSTAIEGNTLTLGETRFVIEEGLTVSGKPLKDHNEVIGHAKAIDLIYDLVKASELTEDALFNLHKAVMDSTGFDFYKPVGAWKNDLNGVNFFNEKTGKQDYIEFPPPGEIPALMKDWIELFNSRLRKKLSPEKALDVYSELHTSFVSIHPFFDGNGRVARLVSNIPVLKAGLPPVIIEKTQREKYIQLLGNYQLEAGPDLPRPGKLFDPPALASFKQFCRESFKASQQLVDDFQKRQVQRDEKNGILKITREITDPETRKKLTALLREKHRIDTALACPQDEKGLSERDQLNHRRALADLEKRRSTLISKISKLV